MFPLGMESGFRLLSSRRGRLLVVPVCFRKIFRNASFGYNTLVSDMRALPIMSKFGFPIVFDATHSVQQPGGMGEKSGGQREFVPHLARAAIAVGVGAIFIETHEDPDNAPSDGPNMVPLKEIKNLLKKLTEIDNLIKK